MTTVAFLAVFALVLVLVWVAIALATFPRGSR